MKIKTECSYCDGTATVDAETRQLEFRKEKFDVVVHFYRCKKCMEEFTTTEVDTVTINQLHNQYREKHQIPFPEEISAVREKYGISAAKMSEVLGFGINGYGNYEKGEIPSLANATLIRTASKPGHFLDMISEAADRISPGVLAKLQTRVNELIEAEGMHDFYYCTGFLKARPCDANGYTVPNRNKIENLVMAITKECEQDFNDRLKINKMLFYIDFVNYRKTGKSITGLSYRAIQLGPVPSDYDILFEMLLRNETLVNEWKKEPGGQMRELFRTVKKCNMEIFDKAEKESISTAIKLFKKTSTWEMVQLSHKEKAWLDNYKEKKLVSFQKYAFGLKGIAP
jgi:putative zinc finger/helix-turn-helix YgiT family protein